MVSDREGMISEDTGDKTNKIKTNDKNKKENKTTTKKYNIYKNIMG